MLDGRNVTIERSRENLNGENLFSEITKKYEIEYDG